VSPIFFHARGAIACGSAIESLRHAWPVGHKAKGPDYLDGGLISALRIGKEKGAVECFGSDTFRPFPATGGDK